MQWVCQHLLWALQMQAMRPGTCLQELRAGLQVSHHVTGHDHRAGCQASGRLFELDPFFLFSFHSPPSSPPFYALIIKEIHVPCRDCGEETDIPTGRKQKVNKLNILSGKYI